MALVTRLYPVEADVAAFSLLLCVSKTGRALIAALKSAIIFSSSKSGSKFLFSTITKNNDDQNSKTDLDLVDFYRLFFCRVPAALLWRRVD